MKTIQLLICLILFGCGHSEDPGPGPQTQSVKQYDLVNEDSSVLIARFNPLPGFFRVTSAKNSFAAYLQHLPLKPHGTDVYFYNGRKKTGRVHEAVIDMDIGNRDLQQCADAIMRLRGEFLFQQKLYDQLHFDFTNGMPVDYSRWMEGYRVQMDGNQTRWIKSARPSNSYESFRQYMRLIFTYAGTLSLARELIAVPYENMQIGDVFIQGGSPGHAMIVTDMAVHPETGGTIFMLAQSYMPAQDVHILKNTTQPGISPWYRLNNSDPIIHTPEWDFRVTDLKRFK